MKYIVLLFTAISFTAIAQEQEETEKVEETFGSTRIINSHSTESLEKSTLEFRISHRFGDIAGTNGGVQTMFGFDNSADIRMAFEYGLSDNLMIGIGRSKGMGPVRSLVDGFIKLRILQQTTDNKIPFSLSVLGASSITYMTATTDSTLVTSFPTFAHRLNYATQLIMARKFGDKFSLAILPTYTHRNYVAYNDQNGLFSIGSAVSLQLTKKMAIIGEYYYNFDSPGLREDNWSAMGIGFEYKTHGHDFHVNITNSRGFGETQFIPGTISDPTIGQFRLGFTITRKFIF